MCVVGCVQKIKVVQSSDIRTEVVKVTVSFPMSDDCRLKRQRKRYKRQFENCKRYNV